MPGVADDAAAHEGPQHPQTISSIVGLARIALAQRRAADAVALAERAVALGEAGDAAKEVADARLLLAKAPPSPGTHFGE